MSLVTIAIPTYDRLEYLKEAVASARAQTYSNIEILIGDDGTSQEIKTWSESITSIDSRVRYRRNQRNLGLAGNWNALADAARGEFMVIIGDDDRLQPNFVESLVKLIRADMSVAFSNHFLIDSDGRRLDQESIAWTSRYHRDRLPAGFVANVAACVWRNSVPISAALLRTRDVQRLRFKEDLNTPEIEFFARWANEGAQFVFTPDYLVEYRTHPASATTNGLRSEALAARLYDIPVPADVEPIKREFMAGLLVDAVSRCLRRGDREAAHEFLRSAYYPHGARGLKPAVTYLAQAVCADLPSGIGSGAYRLMQRAKAAYLTMNIALVAHDLHEHGGHSLYTRRLADALSRQNEVTVFANRCERSNDESWKFTQVPAWRRTALATVATFPLGLRTRARELDQFAIRHAQGFCGGNPNVVTAHICVAAYLESLQDASLRTRLSLRLMAAAEKRFYRRYMGHVIAVSEKVAAELRKFYGYRGHISVIHHGVEAASIDRTVRAADRVAVRHELGIELSETVALYVGDLTKAHSYLKRLAAELPQVRFVIVTKSTRYHWESQNVKIVPATKQITRYYAAADAFVFPTTYDAFGMVVLEAMAAGLPIFTSDRAGAAELVTHAEDGFVFSLNEWVKRTADAFREGEMFSRVGVAARETAERHDWNSVVAKVRRVYFEVANTREPSTVALFSEDEYRYQQS